MFIFSSSSDLDLVRDGISSTQLPPSIMPIFIYNIVPPLGIWIFRVLVSVEINWFNSPYMMTSLATSFESC